ncbi:hypothetical protein SDC9_81017 [bioreactor metagenome]|uniref:Uncharacterized protein n=1 Tax=bioreactor metagenome TaxID=1076179 RepID=A0A644Z900_9ZZZZ
MQRIIRALGEFAVGQHRGRDIGGFERNLDLLDAMAFEGRHLRQHRFHQRVAEHGVELLRPGMMKALLPGFGQTAGIGPHPHRNPGSAQGAGNLFDRLSAAEIAGIDPDARNPALDRRQRQPMIEVNIRHHRQRRCFHNRFQRFGGGHIRHRQADDFAARAGQADDLRQSRTDIGGRRIAHGLNGYRAAAADGDLAQINRAPQLIHAPFPAERRPPAAAAFPVRRACLWVCPGCPRRTVPMFRPAARSRASNDPSPAARRSR